MLLHVLVFAIGFIVMSLWSLSMSATHVLLTSSSEPPHFRHTTNVFNLFVSFLIGRGSRISL